MDEDEHILDEILPPAMTTLTTTPIHNNQSLSWEHKVNLVGEKCPNPRIHVCESCNLPILIYGRLVSDVSSTIKNDILTIILFIQIPCKHVFCYDCAKGCSSTCKQCSGPVLRVEQTGLGTIFRCRRESCHRTYLSQRDLLAHMKHRHSKGKNTRSTPR